MIVVIDHYIINGIFAILLYSLSILFRYLFLETVGGFKCRDIVRRNYDSCVLGDVAGSLFGTGLDNERTEATEIYVFAVCKAVLDNGHELFDYGYNRSLVDAGRLCDFTRYFCFCHNSLD